MALSTKAYKGARDFYPEDKRIQKYMFDIWRSSVEAFGYEEYDAPILEPLEIYLAKTGEEIVSEQTYVFEDRGKRKVVIRPEMTPTVSRMVAGKRQELTYPLRWYSIPNLWRYERPQRGRLREHWQLNVDIFGVSNTDAELELIDLVANIFKRFGASPDIYEIRLNHRELINYLLKDFLKLSSESQHNVSKLIDRMHKMDKPAFISKLDEALLPKERSDGATEKVLDILEVNNLPDLPKDARATPAYQELKNLLDNLKSAGIKNVRYDPTLMRGFDYYTGIVFEVYDADPSNNRSMMGGGRYDGLVGLFGVDTVPTVGFGWGDITLQNFLETHHLLPEIKPESDLYVVLINLQLSDVESLVSRLRDNAVNVTVDISSRKVSDQLKNANKKSLDKILIIGEDELRSGLFKLKDLKVSSEKVLNLDQIIQLLKK
jgi:histidyl-tRNA synthetase